MRSLATEKSSFLIPEKLCHICTKECLKIRNFQSLKLKILILYIQTSWDINNNSLRADLVHPLLFWLKILPWSVKNIGLWLEKSMKTNVFPGNVSVAIWGILWKWPAALFQLLPIKNNLLCCKMQNPTDKCVFKVKSALSKTWLLSALWKKPVKKILSHLFSLFFSFSSHSCFLLSFSHSFSSLFSFFSQLFSPFFSFFLTVAFLFLFSQLFEWQFHQSRPGYPATSELVVPTWQSQLWQQLWAG